MPAKKIKTYTETNNMQRAIKKAGLHAIPYKIETDVETIGRFPRTVYKPVFQCELAEDVTELRGRGWAAELA